jgi:alpha-N-arabinofuranosidase
VGHFRRQGLAGPVYAEIRRKGTLLAQQPIEPVGTDWSRCQVELKPSATATDAGFALVIATPGTVWIDRVSLVPADTVDGWRPDVIAAIRAMRPAVIRWGGSTTEGYSWKDGVGPWERRVPFANLYWGRIDPNLVGIDEFVAFCRAVDAEPLVCLRWSGRKPADAAEQVEYCNGPATSPMGALRANNGHPQPYAVKFWQVGNEVGGDAYDATVADFARAMRKADPSIKILASYISEKLLAGGADLIDYVSPHHYDCANLQGTEASIEQYAELLGRFDPGGRIKLAVTEWNTTAGGWQRDRRHLWTLQNGLACARYLNLCHRHADLVKIACRSNISNSYCSGIIQTDNRAVYGTPAYHVSKLYAEHGGAYPLALAGECALLDLDVSANLSSDGKRLSLAVVNPQREPVVRTIDLGAFAKVADAAQVWTIADALDARDPEATNGFARPERIAARSAIHRIPGPTFNHQFPAYSVSVIEVGVDSK